MKNTQELLNELQKLYPHLTIQIEYSRQLDESNEYTPHLIVMIGKNIGYHFDVGFIHKKTGEFKFETELNIETELNDYYECFEGGYENNINDCLIRMIENIKKCKGE